MCIVKTLTRNGAKEDNGKRITGLKVSLRLPLVLFYGLKPKRNTSRALAICGNELLMISNES